MSKENKSPFNGDFYTSDGQIKNLLEIGNSIEKTPKDYMSPFNGDFYASDGKIRNILENGELLNDSPKKNMSPFNGDFYASDGTIHNIDEIIGNKPTSGGWQRPSSRPAVPVITDNEQIMYLLFGVQESPPNDFAIRLITSIGRYRVEWGDGTINDYDSEEQAEHLYDYANISGNPTEEGYKWVWIKAYPLTGNFIEIDMNVKHNLRKGREQVPQVFEWYMQAPYITQVAPPFDLNNYFYPDVHFSLLEIFIYQGLNLIENFQAFLAQTYNLKIFECYTGHGIIFDNFLYEGGSMLTHPLNLDTSNGINFNYFLASAYGFNQPLNISTPKGMLFAGFLSYANAYNHSLILDLQNVDNYEGDDTWAVSNLNFANMFACKRLRLLNMGTRYIQEISCRNMSLDVNALIDLFNDLADRNLTSPGRIWIQGCFGETMLTPENKEIIISKNWIIVE